MKAMGASAANRFFQVENTLNMLIMLRINTELPLFPQRVPAK
jgi:lysyl-tRNA synthetase class II